MSMDLSTDIAPVAAPDAATDSTSVDNRATTQESPAHKPGSQDDAIEKAIADAGIEDDDEDDLPVKKMEKPEEAEEPQEEDKPASRKVKADDDDHRPLKNMTPEERAEKIAAMTPTQRRRYELSQLPAPDDFTPRGKELWANVPNESKGEFHRILEERSQQISRYQEAIQPLARFDQMARQSGTTLPEALERYTSMETNLRANPAEGMRGLVQAMGMQPSDAIGHILRGFNIHPQALAQHIIQDPQAYFPQQKQEARPQEDPRINQLQTQLEEIKQQQVVRDVLQPFETENPRAKELMPAIAKILESGMVPDSIRDPRQRLEVAYDMAARLNPSGPSVEEATTTEEEDEEDEAPRRAAKPSAANKSVRGAPNGGLNPARTKKGVSKDDAIRLAMSEIGYT